MKTLPSPKIFFVILLLFFISTTNFANDKLQRAEMHYQQAISFYEKGDRDSAISYLKKAISLNRKHAKAYNQLALVYMDDGTVHGRFKATFEMETALKLDPDNLEFRYNYAMLNLKKGLTFEAKRQFKKIIDADPFHYLSYFQLAAMEEENVMHYKDMISIDPTLDGIIYMQSFASEAQQKAADFYKHAISANPRFGDVYYRLALLYYEFDNFNEMIQLLESAVKIMPGDKNCHLFLGFAYQHVQEFDRAEQEYSRAKALMSRDEVKLLESIEPILAPNRQKDLQFTEGESELEIYHENFWKSKDPFYLTEVNERKLEHFSRMAYANLRFSFPEKEIEGWTTDRGKVFIRFGNPLYKYRTRPYIGTYVGGTRNPLHHSKEYWIYENFHFIFEDQYLSGNYAFAWEDGSQPDYKYVYEEMIEDVPDNYHVFPDSNLFHVPMEIVAFKGADGKTDLEICYALPVEKIHHRRNEFQLNRGLFLFDDSWKAVVESRNEIFADIRDVIELNQQKFSVQRMQEALKPGEYFFALEFMDKNSVNRSSLHKDVVVDTFFVEKFQVSDVLFAHFLEPAQSDISQSREHFNIVPNPLRIYMVGQPVIVYYEIYNLGGDGTGSSRYSVEYIIGLDSEAIPGWKKFLTEIKLMKKKGEVATSYEFHGNTKTEIQYQRISLPKELVGEIKLNVQVTDLINGKTITKQERFTVTDGVNKQ